MLMSIYGCIYMKKKYEWWYSNQAQNYQQFKGKLVEILSDVEVKEGQAGFTYE